MHNYYPILWVGAIIGVISTLLIVAAFVVKDGEKETGFERNMKDSEIMQRLMDYAKPFYRQFIVVGFLMLFSSNQMLFKPLYAFVFTDHDDDIIHRKNMSGIDVSHRLFAALNGYDV